MNYDIIIIGGGLGGLTAGAKLAREGKKVFLVEQHDRPGGCATTFRRKGFTCEVGLHEMDGPSDTDLKTRIFSELGVLDSVKFIKLHDFYHFINDRIRITIPHSPAEARKLLGEAFPEEKQGIEAYYSRVLYPKKKIPGFDLQGEMSLGEFLDAIIRNEDLKLVLLGNLGYFSDDPYSLSLTYYCAAQARYFNNGSSYIMGGSQKLSDHLAGYIRSHGGEVLLNHLVTGILAENDRLKGITYTNVKGPGSEIKEALAADIIVNAAMPGIIGLLPSAEGSELKNAIGGQKPGNSLLTVYFGFRKPLESIGHRHYSIFVYDGSVNKISDIRANNRDDFSRRSFTFVDYGQIESGLAPEGKSTGALCCTDYIEDWASLSESEYRAKKDEAALAFTLRLEKLIPGITDLIEYREVATPVTVKRYTLNPGGAVYGFRQEPFRPAVDTEKTAGNLHFASAWSKTGGGFSGAIYAGYLCATGILKKKTV
ncbi:MAG: NAD(P)/FAD-dependent oxidoreductase [Bacteroidales bacterium]|jgi:phytoene dehydrogenase-like protein|nr:NAD(P)/FAD-dependent oxidoreductase [Bacteroidales bacterium]